MQEKENRSLSGDFLFYSANRYYVAKNTGNFLISNNFITNLFVSFLFFSYLCSEF